VKRSRCNPARRFLTAFGGSGRTRSWLGLVFGLLVTPRGASADPIRPYLVDRVDRDGAPLAEDVPAAKPEPTIPDPEPQEARTFLLLDLRWDRGVPSLVATTAVDFGSPRRTARIFGRFALELFRGKELVERVRFDFPLLGAADEKGAIHVAPSLRTRVGVYFPKLAKDAGTRFELVDRRTGNRWMVPLEIFEAR